MASVQRRLADLASEVPTRLIPAAAVALAVAKGRRLAGASVEKLLRLVPDVALAMGAGRRFAGAGIEKLLRLVERRALADSVSNRTGAMCTRSALTRGMPWPGLAGSGQRRVKA